MIVAPAIPSTVTTRTLSAGDGWRVRDVICGHGPGDRRYEEQHDAVSIAVVTQGTFQYRTRQGAAVLVPGALLLGNAGDCFECGHDHGAGDRCLSFHCTPAFMESVAASVAGAHRITFATASLPPLSQLMPLLADAEAARDACDHAAFGELALRVAGAAMSAQVEAPPKARAPSASDERRITQAVRLIELHANGPLPLPALARAVHMSPYHFLRTFQQIAGMTPHQFILRTRLHRAAVRVRRTDDPIAAIAYDAGFNDLSTFNRRFRRLIGVRPSAYRAAR